MEITNKPILIFVWIGDKLPSYAHKSLKHACECSGCDVYLICSKSIILSVAIDNLYKFDYEDFYVRKDELDKYEYYGSKDFWNGFWVKTLERFFVINEFVNNYNITNFFHAELDNIIFNVSDLAIRLNNYAQGIYAPKDAKDRVVGSFIYVNKIETLRNIISIIPTIKDKKNDMYILGEYFKSATDAYALPIENIFIENFNKWEIVPNDIVMGLFDANAVGQYLLGVDPRLDKYSPVYNKFYNENMQFDLNKCYFELENNGEIYISNQNSKLKLYNIHLHSKLFHYFDSHNKILRLLDAVNSKERIIVANKYRLLFKYIAPALRKIKHFLKNFIV